MGFDKDLFFAAVANGKDGKKSLADIVVGIAALSVMKEIEETA